jgi:hypothetical protein
MMKKPSHSTAMLRTMAAVDGKNLTTKRLQKDYQRKPATPGQ